MLPKRLTFIEMLHIWRRYGDPFIHHYFKRLKVLDVGCGSGRFLQRNPGDFYGIDISQQLVDQCLSKGFKAQVGSATQLPFANETIEAVNCDNVIEHLPPEAAAVMINEFARVLKKGGIAVIRSPLGEYVWNTFSHIRPYPPAAIQKLLTNEKEDFIRGDQSHLDRLHIGDVYYSGRYFNNRLMFLLASAWVHFVPLSRKHAYVLVLYKD